MPSPPPRRPALPAPTQVAVWRRDRGAATLEWAVLREGPSGLQLCGRVVGVVADLPVELSYEIACGPGGATDRLNLVQNHGGETCELELVRTRRGWRRDGEPAPELAGCLDVDLGASPSTNLLPIRRLGGASRDDFEIDAAWVTFPDLDVHVSRQRYERLEARLWRYRNLDSGFAAEIAVDAFGLPIDYRGAWSRLAALIP